MIPVTKPQEMVKIEKVSSSEDSSDLFETVPKKSSSKSKRSEKATKELVTVKPDETRELSKGLLVLVLDQQSLMSLLSGIGPDVGPQSPFGDGSSGSENAVYHNMACGRLSSIIDELDRIPSSGLVVYPYELDMYPNFAGAVAQTIEALVNELPGVEDLRPNHYHIMKIPTKGLEFDNSRRSVNVFYGKDLRTKAMVGEETFKIKNRSVLIAAAPVKIKKSKTKSVVISIIY